MLAMFTGDSARGEALFDRARAHPDPWVRATVPFALAQKAENDGEVEETRAQLRLARAAFRETGDRWALGMVLMSWGTLRTIDGALDEAAAALEEAHGLLAELNAGTDTGMLLIRLADVRVRQGRIEEARELVDRSRRAGAPGAGARHDLARAARPLPRRDRRGRRGAARRAAGDARRARGLGPERQHARAIVHTTLAWLAPPARTRAEHLAVAYAAAVGPEDMPILAGVGRHAGRACSARRAGPPRAPRRSAPPPVCGAATTPRRPRSVRLADVAARRARRRRLRRRLRARPRAGARGRHQPAGSRAAARRGGA